MTDFIDDTIVAITNQFRDHAKTCSAPLTLHELNEVQVQYNGTIGFIQTVPNGPIIAITANHVYQKAIEKNWSACILGYQFDLKNNLIDSCPILDMATFRITEKFLKKFNASFQANNFDLWPPYLPQKEKGCFFVGFPGKTREVISEKHISFGVSSIACCIHGISDDNITIHVERHKLMDTPDILAKDFDFGGISGAPLFILYERNVVFWGFGGIIYEGKNFCDDIIFYCRPAKLIKEDGSIVRNN